MKNTLQLTSIATAVALSIVSLSAQAVELKDVYNENVIGAASGQGEIDFGGQASVQFNGSAPDAEQLYCAVEAFGGTSTVKNVGDIILGSNNWRNGALYALNGGTINLTEGINNIKTAGDGYGDSNLFHSMQGTINISVKEDIDISDVYNVVYAQRTDGGTGNSVITLKADGDINLSADTPVVSTNYNDQRTDSESAQVRIEANNVTLTGTKGYAISARSAYYGEAIEYNDEYAGKASVDVIAKDKLVVEGAEGAVFASNGKEANDVRVNLQAKDITVIGDMNIDRKSELTVGGEVDGFTSNITGDLNISNSSSATLNLGNQGSFTGAVNRDVGAETTTSTANIDLGTDSIWNVTGASSVTNVNGTGSMNLASKETTVVIDTLNGNVNAGFETLTADDFASTEELSNMVQAKNYENGSKLTTHVGEGNIKGAMTVTQDENGTTSSTAENTKLESFKGVNASALVQWRNQINHLTKRLGDVRHQKGDIGAWARVYGGEYEWGDANRVDMQTTTVQVGGDARLGDWIVGGAFSYSDSSYDLDNGDGDGDMYSLAVYGTRTFEKGSYVDFVARYGYIKNDIQAGNMDVDFDSNAFSLSVEGGHTFKLMERAYVEPQIEVTYGFAQGDDATASNGVKIEQDDYQNLITRIGFRTGFDFPNEAGTIYAHASYSYDFLGEADGTASQNGLRASLDEDLGGGWVTYGIGGQFRLGESSFAYGELERSTGGDVDNPWAFNVGLRHLF